MRRTHKITTHLYLFIRAFLRTASCDVAQCNYFKYVILRVVPQCVLVFVEYSVCYMLVFALR